MCDGNSSVSSGLEIVLDCDWCGGQGWMEESENRFYADEDIEAEYQQKCQTGEWVDSSPELGLGGCLHC